MDSLKNDSFHVFKTNKGKVLYGGGGITPDIFVALDTSKTSAVSAKLFLKGTIGTFAYIFFQQNREIFRQYKQPKDFAENFAFSNDDWMQFIGRAKTESINLDKISPIEKNTIIQRIKAAMARQIWRNEGYFETMNKQDATVQKAMEY
jgi:carboxyl-terminal processing protease